MIFSFALDTLTGKDNPLAQPNYQYEKRQKELAKKKKKEEKRLRKLQEKGEAAPGEGTPAPASGGEKASS